MYATSAGTLRNTRLNRLRVRTRGDNLNHLSPVQKQYKNNIVFANVSIAAL